MAWTRTTALIANLVLTGGIILNAGHNWLFHGEHKHVACEAEAHTILLNHVTGHAAHSHGNSHTALDCESTAAQQQTHINTVEVPTDLRRHDRCALLHFGDVHRIAVFLYSARIPKPEYAITDWKLKVGISFVEIPAHYQSRAPPHSS